MRLRKITVDNSVKYISKSEQTQERDVEPNTIKNKSLPCKQNKNISQNHKKFIKNIAASGFKYLKWMMNYYF